MKYLYKDSMYTINELEDISGISAATIRARLRSGYSVEQAIMDIPIHESISEFCDASYYKDWIGISTLYLHEIYWNWSISQGYSPIHIKGFTRQIMKLYPNLKVVPINDGKCYHRMIRER